MTPDPARQEHNPYQYCANNPVNLSDPTGGLYVGADADVAAAYDLMMSNLEMLSSGMLEWDAVYEELGLTFIIIGGGGENHGENPQADEPATSLDDAQASGLDGLEDDNAGNTQNDVQILLEQTGDDGLLNIIAKGIRSLFGGNEYTAMSETNQEAGTDYANENGEEQNNQEERSGLTNGSDVTAWYKPEESSSTQSDWMAYPIKPGENITTRVDAVNVNGVVYKIENGYNHVMITRTDQVEADYPWYYFGAIGVDKVDLNWLVNDRLYDEKGKRRRIESQPGSGNYDLLDNQWNNIFFPYNQTPDPR